MTCKCVETVNQALASRNTRLSQAMIFGAHDHDALMLETEQIETGRGKAKAAAMFLSYCPFCGRKYTVDVGAVIEVRGDDQPEHVPDTLARIETAAPRLLAALKRLVAYAEAANDPDWFPEEAERIAEARAAINEAEGGATAQELEASARLFAAAPKMLAALQAVERHNDNPGRFDSYINKVVLEAVAEALGDAASASTGAGLHDDRCASRQGYPCNCASAAFGNGGDHD